MRTRRVFSSVPVTAHGGGLDAMGGHRDTKKGTTTRIKAPARVAPSRRNKRLLAQAAGGSERELHCSMVKGS
jgi:hypothetical protein